MRYVALASDYDGTLAHNGVVEEATRQALERLVRSGRKLILVTGRILPELLKVFPRTDLCALIVAENGALLYDPVTGKKRLLAERPPQSFLDSLRSRGVSGISVGEIIIAAWRRHEKAVSDAIRDSGLQLEIIFNKESMMVLPSGVDKKTGLCHALAELRIPHQNVIAVGDAENDLVFLVSCGLSCAVANALPGLKEKAHFVTKGAGGEGVVELINEILRTDRCYK